MLLQRLVVLARLDVRLHLLHRRFGVRLRVDDGRLPARRLVQAGRRSSCVISVTHPAVEVAEVVRQVGVVDVREALPAEIRRRRGTGTRS